MPDKQPPVGEEINLDGSKSTPTSAPINDKASVGDFTPKHAEYQDLVGPDASNEELVDAILQAAPERLIPWETCKLPSRGIYYGWDMSSVQVRAMGQVADKILATKRLAQTGESIDYLFRECVRFPDGFNSADLLIGDRVFLLYYLRGITHGNMYEFMVTCPMADCEAVSTHAYDLNELAKTIKYADEGLGLEPFKVSLPHLSEITKRDFWVEVRFLRGRDTNDMVSLKRTKKKMFAAPAVRAGQDKRRPQHRDVQIDETLTENLQMLIVSIMGIKKSRHEIALFANKLHSSDTAAIREWLRENSPGIDPTISLTCPECNQEIQIGMPIGESFFRATPVRGDG